MPVISPIIPNVSVLFCPLHCLFHFSKAGSSALLRIFKMGMFFRGYNTFNISRFSEKRIVPKEPSKRQIPSLHSPHLTWSMPKSRALWSTLLRLPSFVPGTFSFRSLPFKPKVLVNSGEAFHLVSVRSAFRFHSVGLLFPVPRPHTNKGMNRNKLQASVGTGGFQSSCRLVSRACN